MSIPTIEELMAADISELTAYDLLEIGPYLGVITGSEVRSGPKGKYINLEVTLHQNQEGDATSKGRKVWRNVSFSEKALTMPGGLANLVQCASPSVPEGTAADNFPDVLAQVLIGETIGINVDHEQGWKNGGPAVDAEGNPIMREAIGDFFKADDSFANSIEADSNAGSDLPF